MGKQTFDRIKRIIAILLLVLFVASLTAASVSAVSSDFNIKLVSTTNDENDNCVSYKVHVSAVNDCSSGDCTYVWDFGTGAFASSKNGDTHTFNDCDAHDISLTVKDNSDGSSSQTTTLNFNPKP